MMTSITLTSDEMARCWRHGEQFVAASKAKLNPRSLAVAGHRGAQFDVGKQARARMAEVAACRWLELDPMLALNWTQYADGGFDLRYRGVRVDVKMTHHISGRCL